MQQHIKYGEAPKKYLQRKKIIQFSQFIWLTLQPTDQTVYTFSDKQSTLFLIDSAQEFGQ